jgi:hypothetical protein
LAPRRWRAATASARVRAGAPKRQWNPEKNHAIENASDAAHSCRWSDREVLVLRVRPFEKRSRTIFTLRTRLWVAAELSLATVSVAPNNENSWQVQRQSATRPGLALAFSSPICSMRDWLSYSKAMSLVSLEHSILHSLGKHDRSPHHQTPSIGIPLHDVLVRRDAPPARSNGHFRNSNRRIGTEPGRSEFT